MKAIIKTETQRVKNKLKDFLGRYYQLHNGVMFMK
jgi:hypothetical protein